jgi:predicted nucleotidyltransferase
MPLFTPEERELIIGQVVDLLRDDPSVEAVVLVGSLVRGGDRWSDIDLEVALADGADADAVAAAWVERLYDELPVVHHFAVAFGSTLVRGFLLRDLLELDLSFTSVREISLWEPNRLMFDRSGIGAAAIAAPASWTPDAPDWAGEAGFTWHDVLHAGTAVRRGRPWQALWYMQRIRNRALSLASERAGNYAEFFDYVDDLPPEERVPLEASLVSSLDPDGLLDALDVATRGFLAELRRGDPELAERLEGPLLEFIAETRQG